MGKHVLQKGKNVQLYIYVQIFTNISVYRVNEIHFISTLLHKLAHALIPFEMDHNLA